jgi:hypothetical protein
MLTKPPPIDIQTSPKTNLGHPIQSTYIYRTKKNKDTKQRKEANQVRYTIMN